jgi:RNA polymerase sigma factor (sigma-70 family)
MAETRIDLILEDLGSPASQEAWSAFLEAYGQIIFQVIRHFESDSEDAADCFQFVCERLCESQFRRLRRFKANGPAKFTTWLRAVVRNLCLDWQRKQFGRPRLFRSVAQLSDVDRQVFHLVHERGTSETEALVHLAPNFPELTAETLSESIERVNHALTSNQRWLLRTRTAFGARRSVDSDDRKQPAEPISAAHDPETLAISAERTKLLGRALRKLPSNERLLLRLRFEEELTLDQIAKLLQLGNAQRVDRQIKQILSGLRREFESGGVDEGGKIIPSSVKAG